MGVGVDQPGITYLPVASISTSPCGLLRSPRPTATGSSGTMFAIRPFSITISFGPDAGVPLPSMMMALRINQPRVAMSAHNLELKPVPKGK